MVAVIEHIRMEVGGKPPKVLVDHPWRLPDAEFPTVARESLASYYNPGTISLRDELQTSPDVPAKNAEAIRLVRDGREVVRYDLNDLRRDQDANGPKGEP